MIVFYTDPHLGLKRLANTTHDSAERLRKAIFSSAMAVKQILSGHPPFRICLGDLFDSYSNDEETILQGYDLMSFTDVVLAGNHDVIARAEKFSSLGLLQKFVSGVAMLNYGDAGHATYEVGNTDLFFIPHTATQELFEQSLQGAEKEAEKSEKWKVLCLHCNYNLGHETTETTLNLSEERALELLSSFHRILIGHEHNTRQFFDGRLTILGNIHPTGFTDISDKYAWAYDDETGELDKIKIWDKRLHFWSGKASQFPEGKEFQFVDLEDDLPPGKAAALASKLFKADTYAVRLSKKEMDVSSELSLDTDQFGKLPDLIEADLENNNPTLLPTFKEMRRAAESDAE